ncbi:MAG: energy-coupling factor transporter transmembrane component T [Bacillota bacterium]|nr:energy-coupling factor transporter transmembrane component T [Bacillota bacterium]
MLNYFERLHPLVSFLFYTGALMIFILLFHPVYLCAGLVVVLLIHFMHDYFYGLRYWLKFMLTTALLFFLLNPLFNTRGRHLLFLIGNHRITEEALIYGGMNALSILGIMAIFVLYNEVMTPNKLLFLFSKFLPQFAILLMLTLRFIPLMRRRLSEISAIQLSKGISISHGDLKEKLGAAMQYIQVFVTFSLEEAIQTADSMKARGYGQGRRTSYEHFSVNIRDILAILYLVILFSMIIFCRILGYGYLKVYPIMGTWQLSNLDYGILVLLILFLSFPILIEIGGMIRWRLSN